MRVPVDCTRGMRIYERHHNRQKNFKIGKDEGEFLAINGAISMLALTRTQSMRYFALYQVAGTRDSANEIP